MVMGDAMWFFYLYKYSNAANTPPTLAVFFFSQSQSDAQHLYDKNVN